MHLMPVDDHNGGLPASRYDVDVCMNQHMLLAQGWMVDMPQNRYAEAFLRRADSYCSHTMMLITEPANGPMPNQYWLCV